MRSTQSLLAFVIALVLLAVAAGCSGGLDTAQAASPPPAPPAEAARSAAPQPATHEFIASGPIIVENQVDVLSQRDGLVLKVYADIGKRVHRGDLLAKLDSSQLEADRAALQHTMRAAADNAKFHETEQGVNKADLARAEKMFAAGLITKEQLEHTRFLRDATVWEIDRENENQQQNAARIRSLDLEIAKTHIVAPFDGVVARRYVRVGQKVAPNDRLFWVTAEKPLLVRFTLPQEYLLKIKTGSTVTVTAPFADKERHSAQVIGVSPVVDPSSGTIEVLARLTGPTGSLRPGMTANIRLDSK